MFLMCFLHREKGLNAKADVCKPKFAGVVFRKSATLQSVAYCRGN